MVEILDSTLREGEQTPGVTFSIEEKLEIARLLDDVGVDIIEAGHPAVSDDIRIGLKEVAGAGLNASVLGHSRAQKRDIDLLLDLDVDWVGIFISVMDGRLKNHFRKDLSTVIEMVTDSVQYAKDHGLKVRYTPEDTMRSDPEAVFSVSMAAISAGADRISVADTVGAASPKRMESFVRELISRTGARVNVHCHNDLGLALANSLAAHDGGAVLIDACVNGLGERAGITDLSSLMMALKVHYKIDNKWNLELLPRLSDLVERKSGMKVASNAPVVGNNAFSHNAGLHVSAAFIDPSFYEVVPAELVGRGRTFEADKMAGGDLVRKLIVDAGGVPDNDSVARILKAVKNREKGSFTSNEIRSLLTN